MENVQCVTSDLASAEELRSSRQLLLQWIIGEEARRRQRERLQAIESALNDGSKTPMQPTEPVKSMNDNLHSTRSVLLSPADAVALARVLDRARTANDEQGSCFQEIRDQLSDSLWVAGWLKGKVELELQTAQMIDLLAAVVASLAGANLTADEEHSLDAIVGQLNSNSAAAGSIEPQGARPSAAATH
jgi:hypothetical protein